MKKFLLAGMLAGAVAAYAGMCDDTYNLQSATQTIRSGLTNNLSSSTKNVGPNLAGVDTLLFIMTYKLPLSFKPNCTVRNPPASITYRKKVQGQGWTLSTENYPRIQLYDSTTPLRGHPEYYWWFGFSPTSFDTLIFYMGAPKGPNIAFESWYGIAYIQDSTKNVNTGLWQETIQYIAETVGPVDSARLDTLLVIRNGWKDRPVDANHRPRLFIQTVKLSFTSQISGLRPHDPKNGSIAAWQQGSTAWFNAGADLAAKGESIELCDMFGRKVALLYPTGYLYSWNGRTPQGSPAPAGVYFARSGQRLLGKFLYSR